MPQVIPAIIAFAGTAVGKIVVGTAINLAIGAVTAKLNQPKGPKPRDLQTQVRSGAADRVQHFGKVRVGGALMFADFAEVDGTRRAFVLLAISTGGITAVDQYYLDGKPVSVDANGYVTTAPWDGGKVRLRAMTGIFPQRDGGNWGVLHSAFPMRWIAGVHRLEGVATILGEFDSVEPEDVNDVYPGGRPPEITANIRGVPCYDPTGGSDAFSLSPSRHLMHYLSTGGSGKIPVAEFAMPSWLQAIADCNNDLPTQGGTRNRYEGGGSYALNEPLKDVAARWLEAMGGNLYLTDEGLIGLRVAKLNAPVYTIDDAKVVSMDCGPGKSQLDRVTTLVPEYVEPTLDYTETTADPWEDSRAIARFGEPKPRELSLLVVQHHGQARALAKIAAARQNPRITASASLRFWGLLLMGQERVYLNRPDRGLVNVPMRITAMSLDLGSSDGVVKVELESDDAATYAWTLAEEGDKPLAPARAVHGRSPILAPVITGVDVETDGGVPPAFIAGTVAPITSYITQVQFRPSGGAWTPVNVNQATGYFRTPELADAQTYEVRARRLLGGINALAIGIGGSSDDVTKVGPWTALTGIVVIANNTPPAQPVLRDAYVSGTDLVVVFEPDLGANYGATGIWRGATFASATFLKFFYDQSSLVTGRVPDIAGSQTYWLRSGNGSGVTSAPLNIGTF